MFESPNTQTLWLQQHHLLVQERPATIAPKSSALSLLKLPFKRALVLVLVHVKIKIIKIRGQHIQYRIPDFNQEK